MSAINIVRVDVDWDVMSSLALMAQPSSYRITAGEKEKVKRTLQAMTILLPFRSWRMEDVAVTTQAAAGLRPLPLISPHIISQEVMELTERDYVSMPLRCKISSTLQSFLISTCGGSGATAWGRSY